MIGSYSYSQLCCSYDSCVVHMKAAIHIHSCVVHMKAAIHIHSCVVHMMAVLFI